MLIDNCSLLTAHYLLPVAYHSLITAHCLLPIAHYSLLISYYLLPTTHYLFPITYCPLLTIYFLLPIAHYSLLISYCYYLFSIVLYLLPTNHFSYQIPTILIFIISLYSNDIDKISVTKHSAVFLHRQMYPMALCICSRQSSQIPRPELPNVMYPFSLFRRIKTLY